MSTDPRPSRTRLRAAAVVIALVAGVAATVATTPPLEKCPSPPPDGVVSEFFGPQEYDEGIARRATPSSFVGGGYEVLRTDVHLPSCVTAAETTAPVSVWFDLGGEGTPAVPEATLRSLTITDGSGRSWSPSAVDSREWLPPYSEGGSPERAYASLQFDLPLGMTAPVTLHLGDLSGPDVDELSLDEQPPDQPSPGVGVSEQAAP